MVKMIMNPLENLLKYDIILASASPRRRELLSNLGIKFRVEVIDGIKEIYPEDLPVDEIPEFLSKLKADSHGLLVKTNQLIIASDTIVICDGIAFGKPDNAQQAKQMLRNLSAKTHKVITGVTILSAKKQTTFKAVTEVEMAEISDDEIDFYVDTFNPTDKAGAYGIQDWIGCIGVRGIKGSFYNVMGLPLHRLYTELKAF